MFLSIYESVPICSFFHLFFAFLFFTFLSVGNISRIFQKNTCDQIRRNENVQADPYEKKTAEKIYSHRNGGNHYKQRYRYMEVSHCHNKAVVYDFPYRKIIQRDDRIEIARTSEKNGSAADTYAQYDKSWDAACYGEKYPGGAQVDEKEDDSGKLDQPEHGSALKTSFKR
ncbi:MAG: hypothetical protein LUC99_04290 [Clostridiales bacterium]|nr:hypothetical protein [Clostridiales bacterium]